MTDLVNDEELVEVVEDLRDRIYDKHEVKGKRDLDLLMKELKKTLARDFKAAIRAKAKPETSIDHEEYIG